MNAAYKNYTDKESKPLTGCVQQGIFALVLKEIIFIVSFQHSVLHGKFCFLFLKSQAEN
jgi:hypothetical protein